ncbi:response regulator transcription factor [Halobacillus shinanisalinarum]|uniref:Response regulator transcription factor n=1 Tax=Halobacillus shinanisalinarum TaxID=2932258 RepID=A0ABY4H543_9BACI|nr:response regulator transcription factor [Halobacillus shinanisalinarum]UOQ95030.1 response regulator transcription factor [Halobacillus shinanisalinarum]
MVHILYLEDDIEIGEWVTQKLRESNYKTTWLTSGVDLPENLSLYDLVILDVMLPGLDGFSIGRRVKRNDSTIPIIMLSARTSIDDKLEGLEFADDYVTKPFHPEELIKRVEVQLRKYERSTEQTTQLGHLEINQHVIMNRETNEEIILTGKQFYIFRFFLKHLNQILTKEQLYEGVWQEPYREGDKALMVHIRHLRGKIEKDPSNPIIIETIRGIGYRVRA